MGTAGTIVFVAALCCAGYAAAQNATSPLVTDLTGAGWTITNGAFS